MKDKIVFLIIGVLIGAIITTAGFLIYNKTLKNSSNQPEMMQMNENGQMEAPANGNMEEPPAKPDGDNGEEPPAKPDGDNGEESPEKPEDLNNNMSN